MPIYAYRCESCGFSKDALQKVSDAPLADCPSCGQSTFKKQLTAAGFQLKGTGWYVTDFRNGSGGSGGAKAPAAPAAGSTDAPATEKSTPAAASGGSTSTASDATSTAPTT